MSQKFSSKAEYEFALSEMDLEKREGFQKIMEFLKPWETLHPDLAARVYETERLGHCLQHPLVFDPFYAPGVRDGNLNDIYKAKLDMLRDYAAEGNWHGWVFTHERAYRLDALVDVLYDGHLAKDPEAWWKLVSDVWVDTENARQNYHDWHEIFWQDIPERESMMDADEQEVYDSLRGNITIYRGYRYATGRYNGLEGFSWTLDREKAVWFARRFKGAFDDTCAVATGMVYKRDVIAYLDGRGEQEILVLPESVEILNKEEIF